MSKKEWDTLFDESVAIDKKDFPFLSDREAEELIEELQKFLERFYALQIEGRDDVI